MKKLLDEIRSRGQKQTAFGYGILTADKHVQGVADAIGIDSCYRHFAKGQTSFHDILQKASEQLVYSNEDLGIDEKLTTLSRLPAALEDVAIPKNTLMIMRNTITSDRTDRDQDILVPNGAELDPKMPLLWQHIPAMPIGKMLAVANRNGKRIKLWTAIVDVNQTAHDAAVMFDNDMLRFSHGFRALDWEPITEERDGYKYTVGYKVKRYEMMEESAVSVPSNVDAEPEAILSLVEGGKLTSPIMKEMGKQIRENMAVQVSGITMEKSEENEDVDETVEPAGQEPGKQADGGEGDETGTPKETDGDPGEDNQDGTEDKEVTEDLVDLKEMTLDELIDVRQGTDCKDTFNLAGEILADQIQDGLFFDWDQRERALKFIADCYAGNVNLDEFIEEHEEKEFTVKDAMTLILAKATRDERQALSDQLGALKTIDERTEKTNQYRPFLG